MGINLYTLSAEQLRKVEKERGAMNEKVGIKERIGMIFSDGEYLEIGSENNCLEEGPYVKYTSENSLYIIREAIKSSGYERLEDLRLFLNPREDRHCKDRLKRPLPMLPRFFKIIIPYWSKNVSEKVAIHNT
jgi:hypothetical protein